MTELEMLVVGALGAAHNMETALEKHSQGSAEFDADVQTHVLPLVLLQVRALAGQACAEQVADLIAWHQSGEMGA